MAGLKYTIFQTRAGWLGILASDRGLLALTFPRLTRAKAAQELGLDSAVAISSADFFGDLPDRLKFFFEGQPVTFPDELDYSQATPFQRRVWQATRLIPYGNTRSYRWIAEQLGIADTSRAVGQALGRNPLPIIIPCHRVLTSDGKLGGFSGGLAMKRRLLTLEKKKKGRS